MPLLWALLGAGGAAVVSDEISETVTTIWRILMVVGAAVLAYMVASALQ